jgi:hypothetical protein
MTNAWNQYFLSLIQRELDIYIDSFKEDISNLQNQRSTKRNFKELEKFFCDRIKNIIDMMEFRLQNNPKIPREFYWKNMANFTLEVIKATQTSIGKLIQEYNPKFKQSILDKILEFSKSTDSHRMESISEVENLRRYCRKL